MQSSSLYKRYAAGCTMRTIQIHTQPLHSLNATKRRAGAKSTCSQNHPQTSSSNEASRPPHVPLLVLLDAPCSLSTISISCLTSFCNSLTANNVPSTMTLGLVSSTRFCHPVLSKSMSSQSCSHSSIVSSSDSFRDLLKRTAWAVRVSRNAVTSSKGL